MSRSDYNKEALFLELGPIQADIIVKLHFTIIKFFRPSFRLKTLAYQFVLLKNLSNYIVLYYIIVFFLMSFSCISVYLN